MLRHDRERPFLSIRKLVQPLFGIRTWCDFMRGRERVKNVSNHCFSSKSSVGTVLLTITASTRLDHLRFPGRHIEMGDQQQSASAATMSSRQIVSNCLR
ncbi:hypothetical protein PHSY_001755 [Pseudozyma hubeiensis SY62]|uniref:Uncharacterized protein n=1 Tax=Pseudozyma hubeiensis (strain SY62) TaxID=1305764 RepID=R9NZH8_PSEHS|nr:hypothetical protein PHSY_001755 [Pseudozyma hubeiensis SY62]GAC94184.1 hypothetical protein PHSY_001755 [Pseudozyma hubeiensis SY62]